MDCTKFPITRKFKCSFRWLFSVFFLLLVSVNEIKAADAAKGEATFKQYCASCHKIESKLVGPPLAKIYEQQSEAWLIKWIRNNADLRKANDKEAMRVYTEYGKQEMPSFLSFKDDDIKDILAYVKKASEEGPTPSVSGAPAPGAPVENPYTGLMLWFLIGALAVAVIFLARNNLFLTRVATGEAPAPVSDKSGRSFWRNPRFIAVVTILIVVVGFYKVVESSINFGRSQGYQPEQPIAYSHKVHAGINGINCRYCHVGAENGKQAGIPSLNICMNCHKAIQEYKGDPITKLDGTPVNGTAEIHKIYAALGFDPATGKTDSSKQHAVQWVRLHNLPDHVYFNHSQHVVAGQIECQKCHGEIQTMDVVHQEHSLAMGWCIKCHRETNVRFNDNNYYSMFEKLHDDLKKGKIKQVTEADMGGTECQKCHY